MNVKNYTSTVPGMNSAAAIEKLLVDAGTMSVNKWYADKQLKTQPVQQISAHD
jgi:hypothetical protein